MGRQPSSLLQQTLYTMLSPKKSKPKQEGHQAFQWLSSRELKPSNTFRKTTTKTFMRLHFYSAKSVHARMKFHPETTNIKTLPLNQEKQHSLRKYVKVRPNQSNHFSYGFSFLGSWDFNVIFSELLQQ